MQKRIENDRIIFAEDACQHIQYDFQLYMQTEREAKNDPEKSNKLQMRELDVKDLVYKQFTEIPSNITKEQVFEAHMWIQRSDLGIWRKC